MYDIPNWVPNLYQSSDTVMAEAERMASDPIPLSARPRALPSWSARLKH
jgi:hypothetical protein